jgi:phosphate transport system permease protein
MQRWNEGWMNDMPNESIARPPSAGEMARDRCFRGLTLACAWLTILVVLYLVWEISGAAGPAVKQYGAQFLTSSKWDSGKEEFGIAPQIWGTIYSSILGVGIGSIFGVMVAIFLTEEFLPPKWELIFKNIIELLAAIPSVVYGLWGIFIVIPAIRPAANWLHSHLGWIPIFGTRLSGPGLLPAALVLAIMVLPTVSAISRDALMAVPRRLREAAFGLGATRWEAILAVILPTAARGIYGAILLAFGRALGETMALAMLVGDSDTFTWSMFSPANTLAALVAKKFNEASKVEIGALMYAALVLMGITLLVNIIGAVILQRSNPYSQGSAK